MQLTKFTHACVRLDDGDRSLVIDPGVFSEVDEALDGADAVLITHEHADHVETERVLAAARRDPRLRVWAPAPVAAGLGELGEQVVTVGAGEQVQVAGFDVRTFGGQHALIHPTVPVIANVGYLISTGAGPTVCHPGDCLIVPPGEVDVLLLPVNAPWSKMAEVMDYAVAVRAPRMHQIHDAMLAPAGCGIVDRHVEAISAAHGVRYERLDAGATATI